MAISFFILDKRNIIFFGDIRNLNETIERQEIFDFLLFDSIFSMTDSLVLKKA